MVNFFLILLGKLVAFVSRLLNRGNGSTWPGHIALSMNPHFIHDVVKKSGVKTIFVVGTNGKTTTSHIIATLLSKNGKRVLQNDSGANLLNGVASAFLLASGFSGKVAADYAIFEIDENTLPLVTKEIIPFAVVVLNLYRDQLDRYGELDSIAKKWHAAFKQFPKEVHVFLNADDPLVAFLGEGVSAHTTYFGLKKSDATGTKLSHAADSIYCPRCQEKLSYEGLFYSHNGLWHCPNCKLKRPEVSAVETKYPLAGLYNKYNTNAAVLVAKQVGIVPAGIEKALHFITPAFGRQEKITFQGKDIEIFLSKNPTSFNQSLETAIQLGAKRVLLVLNDRIPDGRDVSWIWDIDLESYVDKFSSVVISGDRAYDMGLRVQYSSKSQTSNSKSQTNTKYTVEQNLTEAINKAITQVGKGETLYVLATYSAMLEVRKIITGKKIL